MHKVTLVPSFYLLIEHHDCRAYYNKSVLDITQFWFDYFGFNNIDFSQLQSTYPAMTYCVQFNESVFDFLSRLFSQYGIYYFFEFDDAAHTLVLADNVSSYYENNMLLKIGEHANYFIKDFCHSFDPQPMNIKMISSRSYPGHGSLHHNQQDNSSWSQVASEHEVYLNPVHEVRQLKHKIQLYRGRFKAKEEMLHFSTNLMTLKLCQVVRIDDQLNQAWVVTRINHQVADDGNLLNTNHPGSCIANQISAIPSQICCLPPLLPKPLFSGVHTATVIGPSRNDVYSDDVGRVKVKFHWDHEQAPLCDVNWVGCAALGCKWSWV